MGPPIGAIRWDAFSNDSSLTWWTATGLNKSVPSWSKFHFRKPALWDNFQLWRQDETVDTAAIVESEIDAARGALDFWLYDFYPPFEVLEGTGDETPHSFITSVMEAHAAAPNKTDVKFAFIIFYVWMMYPGGSGDYFQEQCDYIAAKMQDPAYMRVNGKPLIAVWNDGFSGDVAAWDQLKTTIGEPVYGVSVNSVSLFTDLSLNAIMRYEYNGATVVGNGRHPYTDMITSDVGGDGAVPGADRVSNRTLYMDRRTFASPETATVWVDQPTQPQWMAAVASGGVQTQKLEILATWDEIAEQGIGLTPSLQEGTRYLDAVRWVRTQQFPSDYSYELNCATTPEALPGSGVARSGSWTYSFPDSAGVAGAHDGDEMISATTNDYLEIEHKGVLELGFYAIKGPDRGIATFTFDGGGATDVDLYASVQSSQRVLVWSHVFGDALTHKVRGTVKGTKNASSSSVQVGLDSFFIRFSPVAVRP